MNYTRNRTVHVTVQAPGVGTLYQGPVRHDIAADETGRSKEDLDRLIGVSDFFYTSYRAFMSPAELARLTRDLERARAAVASGASRDVRDAFVMLIETMYVRCGTASLLFSAEDVSQSITSTEEKRKLKEATSELKRAHIDNRPKEDLELYLRTVIAAEQQRRAKQGNMAQQVFGGRLRVTDM
jgi:hypothetical protein